MVSTVAQTLEMAKSELKRERQKVIRERVKKPRMCYHQLETYCDIELSGRMMNQFEENHGDKLYIFTPPPSNTAIQREFIIYRAISQLSNYADLEFLLQPQSAGYMDLKKSTLKVKVQLTDSSDIPILKDENVGLVNLG
ncbi:Hypothetical predicted protein [Mytilus galloprovincialis]|uniref:Uncharacterized protein n=1 Tax=Mytilus galloprovincialis TaxID=29158 RepID=A0A8B6D9A8_MYTGA|nr:Hypothetical predicted protein [Mytilus galloprovincialis]